MWFAALGSINHTPWLINLLNALAYNSPGVVGLFESNPFPETPPDFFRINAYYYNFTTIESHVWKKNGDIQMFLESMIDVIETGEPKAWWTRRKQQSFEYLPVIKQSEKMFSDYRI
jgi:hypothetical protein